MPESLYVLVKTVLLFLDVLVFAMFARFIFERFFEAEGKIFYFLYVFTEPAVLPLRKLFNKMNWFQGLPLDMAYMFTYLVIFVLQFILELSLP